MITTMIGNIELNVAEVAVVRSAIVPESTVIVIG